MSKTSETLTFILRKLWTLIAISLVLVALLISALRYSLPYLDDQKDNIEAFVLQEYGIDLVIGKIDATWHASGPSLVLNDVKMRQGDASPIMLEVGDLYLLIDFWPSISSASLQSTNVRLSELHLHINLAEMKSSDENVAIVQALETVFLDQLENFSVDDSKLTLVTNESERTIHIDQLSWLNKDSRHQGLGLFSLNDYSNNNAKFIIDLYGSVEDYTGKFYAQGQQIDIAPWINELGVLQAELENSDGNFELWADIADGGITKIQGAILPSQFSWKGENELVSNSLSAEFFALPTDSNGENWQFTFKDLSLGIQEEKVNSAWLGSYNQAGDIYIENTTPFELTQARGLTKLVSKPLAQTLEDIDLAFSLTKAKIAYSNNKGVALSIRGGELSYHEKGILPGIEQLHFDIDWAGNKGLVTIEQPEVKLTSEMLLEKNISLEDVSLPIAIEKNADGLLFSVDQMSMVADGLEIDGSVEYAAKSKEMSLFLNTEVLELSKLRTLLPNQLMGQETKQFLTRAFSGTGRVEYANILWHGAIPDYPFVQNEGVFQTAVRVNEAELTFSSEWPAVTQLDVDLLFENNALYMRSDSSYLKNVHITNFRAEVPELKSASNLIINARGSGSGEDLSNLLLDSSLDDTLGRILSQDVVVSGLLNTDLKLTIPLSDAQNVRAQGTVNLVNNDVRIAALGLSLTESMGELRFDNQDLVVKDVNAVLFEQPISLNLLSVQNDTYDLDIGIRGQWVLDKLLLEHAPDLTESVAGTADWLLNIDVQLQEKDYKYTANFTSDLLGVSSSLPAPLDKALDDVFNLKLVANGNNIASVIRLSANDQVRFEGALPHKEKRFNRAHLSLGETDFFGMGAGFSISANLPEMDVSHWYRTVNQILSGKKSNSPGYLDVPQRIFVEADQVNFGDTRITDMGMTAKRNQDNWLIDFDADQTRGTATIFDQWVSRGVEISVDYIKFKKTPAPEFKSDNGEPSKEVLAQAPDLTETSIDPESLPTIRFDCADCTFAGLDFGKVTLVASPNDDGLEINQLSMRGESGRVNASGQWYKRHKDHYTFLVGDAQSNDFGRYLQAFDVDSGIKDSEALMDFQLTWKNSPLDFNFSTLDGEINWQLTDGYLNEVSDKGSRIFTLLSLNSLVRKLSLDFRDVFAKGFFYDEMNGSIQITEGKADTRDTNIDGAAGEIEIYGYTDLVSKELNYNVSFAPNVTGNLPVLVYFFTVSPPSALAALALDQVLTSTKVISNVNYSVTGTIKEPILIETGRESTEVDLPARRIPSPQEDDPTFIPPTTGDIIEVQAQDG
ncbi:YhdP family protein [Agaribacter marinus]|uniref:DUF3971 domain-containing protein n=1 Tax=Agaribacter marinus TaxID=1431249 RepID=A0AA37T2A2_9ALTE|nr:YhdP family protein [Agaribacter marinus]GLR72251.1 DUF3971 domain-containing protein [Agaribacter marinus]